MLTNLAHITGSDTTTVVTAFILGLTIGAALVYSHVRRWKGGAQE